MEGGLVELVARGAYATDKSERYLRAYEPFLALSSAESSRTRRCWTGSPARSRRVRRGHRSQVGDLTRTSFWHLFEHHLRPEAVYVVEEWGTGYWPSFPDGRAPDGTPHVAGMVGFVKELVDECAAADITDPHRGTPP